MLAQKGNQQTQKKERRDDDDDFLTSGGPNQMIKVGHSRLTNPFFCFFVSYWVLIASFMSWADLSDSFGLEFPARRWGKSPTYPVPKSLSAARYPDSHRRKVRGGIGLETR